jgi:alanine-glyoxylate transaminase/serine-glyoxylate transaminase/serine-pyruvate transaminase
MAKRPGLAAEVIAWSGADEHLPNAAGWRRGVQAAGTIKETRHG